MIRDSVICWENETRKENAKGAGKEKGMRGEERLKGERDEVICGIDPQIPNRRTENHDCRDSQSARGFGADPIKVSTFNECLRAPLLTYALHVLTVAGGNFRETSRGECIYLRNFRRHHDDDSIIVLSLLQSGRWQIDVSAIHLIYLAAPQIFPC